MIEESPTTSETHSPRAVVERSPRPLPVQLSYAEPRVRNGPIRLRPFETGVICVSVTALFAVVDLRGGAAMAIALGTVYLIYRAYNAPGFMVAERVQLAAASIVAVLGTCCAAASYWQRLWRPELTIPPNDFWLPAALSAVAVAWSCFIQRRRTRRFRIPDRTAGRLPSRRK